jgi:hypothetical protein
VSFINLKLGTGCLRSKKKNGEKGKRDENGWQTAKGDNGPFQREQMLSKGGAYKESAAIVSLMDAMP